MSVFLPIVKCPLMTVVAVDAVYTLTYITTYALLLLQKKL